jgi:hypothetical protein
MRRFPLVFSIGMVFLFFIRVGQGIAQDAEESIVVYGEYPVREELGKNAFPQREQARTEPLIDYARGSGFEDRALIEALHFLNANVYGYSFMYKPGSKLLETEEVFTIELRGKLKQDWVQPVADGVRNNVYRIKIELSITPSMRRWTAAFTSNQLRLQDAEGNSDFYTGWEGRSDAYREALRNLVLVSARKQLSSKPLIIEGDILLKGNPTFNVGAGRHYCRIEGYVKIVDVVTYD